MKIQKLIRQLTKMDSHCTNVELHFHLLDVNHFLNKRCEHLAVSFDIKNLILPRAYFVN